MNLDHISDTPVAFLVTMCWLMRERTLMEIDGSVYWITASSSKEAYAEAEKLGISYEKSANQAFSEQLDYIGISEIMPVYETPCNGHSWGGERCRFMIPI